MKMKKATLNRLLVRALEGMGDAYRAALLEEETEDDMPQDEIEWVRSGERGVKAQGGSPPHTKKRGSRACSHLRRSGGLSPATGAAQLCYQQRREQVVSQHHDIGGGASYGTRVMDMKMSLTLQRCDGGARGGSQPGCVCGGRHRLRG